LRSPQSHRVRLAAAQVVIAAVVATLIGTLVFGDPLRQSVVTGVVIGLAVAATYYVFGAIRGRDE